MTCCTKKKSRYEKLFKLQHGKCWICSSIMMPLVKRKRKPSNCATFDHILPVSMGGGFWASNLRLACKKCNELRGRAFFDVMQHPIFNTVEICWNDYLAMTPGLRKQAMEKFVAPTTTRAPFEYAFAFPTLQYLTGLPAHISGMAPISSSIPIQEKEPIIT